MTSVDRTGLTEHLARRLRAEGASHPVAGAVALAARGSRQLTVSEFSTEFGVAVDAVRAAEAGQTAFAELPAEVGAVAESTGVDLLSLADLEQAWRAPSSAVPKPQALPDAAGRPNGD